MMRDVIVITIPEMFPGETEVVNTLFVVLAIMGVVNDPTTSGISDSERAMTYETPKKDAV